MKSKLKPRIDLEGRTRLEMVVPLDTPYLIFIDPSSLCNAKCPFCPTGAGELVKYRTPGLMDFELYKKIINDLCDMPSPIKTLRLYLFGEPTLNPYLPDMVRFAKSTGRFGQIDTTVNGKILIAKKLANCGLDKIFISVPSDYDEKYVKRIARFYSHVPISRCKVYVKIIGDTLSIYKRKKFFDDFGENADYIFIENQINCWPNFRAGDNPSRSIYGTPVVDVRICPYPLYSLSINSDGNVSACFLDYPNRMILGDLKIESFKSIWNGEKLRDFRIMQLRGYRKEHPFCGNCKQLSHGCPDDIDEYAKILLDRITYRGYT